MSSPCFSLPFSCGLVDLCGVSNLTPSTAFPEAVSSSCTKKLLLLILAFHPDRTNNASTVKDGWINWGPPVYGLVSTNYNFIEFFFSKSQSNLIAKDDIVGSPRIFKNYKRHGLSNTFTYWYSYSIHRDLLTLINDNCGFCYSSVHACTYIRTHTWICTYWFTTVSKIPYWYFKHKSPQGTWTLQGYDTWHEEGRK